MFFRALVALVLAGFLFKTGIVLVRFGYLGFFEVATSNGVMLQFFLDLVICLSLIAVWIYFDARKLGVSPWPFIVAGGIFGIAGPLAYVIRRPRSAGTRELPMHSALAGGVLALFGAFSLVVLTRYGYMTFVFYAGANEATELLFYDLALSTLFVMVLVVRDGRARGASYGPFLPIAFLFGGLAPLTYLVTRKLPRTGHRAAGLAALGAAVFMTTLGSGHADLRNHTVRTADAEAERRGRERLEQLAERHGLSAWKRHLTMETVALDEWPRGGPWWPQDDQRFRSQALLGTFTSRVELLDGAANGEVWGIQAWSPYKKKSIEGEAEFLREPDRAIIFYLPTLQYFNELPFRLLSAPVVREAGSARHRGRTYDLVFATWETPEPRPDVDHYVLWIDRETGLLAKARYTVREGVALMPALQQKLSLPLVAGTIHFEDYREIDGVQVPFRQTVTLNPPELTRYPLEEHFFHRLTLEEAAFDILAPEEVVPDLARGMPGDRKPTE